VKRLLDNVRALARPQCPYYRWQRVIPQRVGSAENEPAPRQRFGEALTA